MLVAVLAGWALWVATASAAPAQDAGPAEISAAAAGRKLFTSHIRPLFQQHCLGCHQAGTQQPGTKQNDLDLTSRKSLLKGGRLGPSIVPGDGKASVLYQVVTHQAKPSMPLQGEKLSPDLAALIALWIDLGAPFANRSAERDAEAASAPDGRGRKLFTELREILETKCLACHGGKFKQAGLDISTRESLLRGGDEHSDIVIPGNASASLLVKKIRHSDDPGMPYQGDKLPADTIAKIERWINTGAPYAEPLNVANSETQPAFLHGSDHWAYQKPVRPPVPAVNNTSWVRNPIDAFLAAEHDKRKLTPLAEAGKRTLARRVYLDLTGLPPTPGELRDYLADDSPAAYETLVDALLASPRYGERWGRHWMDIWRYSDWYGRRSAGDLRNSQPYVYHWRDWIIESLNRDKPYDRMIQEMLAADEIAPGDPDALRATGYLARNWFRFNRNVWLRDTVEYTAASFLGVTLKCARCHDHKFDPIAQEEYYKFRAFFEPHDVRTDRLADDPNLERDGLPRVHDAEPRAALTDAPFLPAVFAETYRFIGGNENTPDKDKPLSPGVPEVLAAAPLDIRPVNLPLEAYYPDLRDFATRHFVDEARAEIERAEAAVEKAKREISEARQRVGTEPSAKTRHQPAADTEKSDFKKLVKPVLDAHCISCHGGRVAKSGLNLTSETSTFEGGVRSGAVVLPANATESPLIEFLRGTREPRMPYRQPPLAEDEIRRIEKWIAGLPAEPAKRSLQRVQDALAVAEKRLVWARANLPAVEARIAAERAKFAEPAAPDKDELAEKALDVERRAHLLWGSVELLRALQQLDDALGQAEIPDEGTQNENSRKGREKKVAAATKRLSQAQAALGKAVKEYTPLGQIYPRQSTGRRTALARWITSPDNPLTARVAVNHIWMRHFGAPLVPTVSNFGMSGKPPTHPELLDWLAVEFMESGWSMKKLHRLMLTSSTYRMRSTPEQRGYPSLAIDPDNTYFWRMHRRRMEAEAVRDSVLHVAGELDTTMGGPEIDEAAGQTSRRRSLYFTHTPNSQMLFLQTFDVGNPSECYRRHESIIPQQALAMANSKLTLEMARLLTRKLAADSSSQAPRASFVDAAFERVLGRLPTIAEQKESLRFLSGQAELFRDSSKLTRFRAAGDELADRMDILPSDDPQVRARENLVHVLLNRNEFLVIR